MSVRWIIGWWLAGCQAPEEAGTRPPHAMHRMFVAVEEDGAVAVLDGADAELIATVDLSAPMGGDVQRYAAHNVQGAPDGKTVWVTAVPVSEGGGHEAMEMPDELVGIDVATSTLTSRIGLGLGVHAAHVVLDGLTAWVTGFESDSILVVDTEAGEVTREVTLPAGTGPHGARLTHDGGLLVVAGLGDGSVHLVDTTTGGVSSIDLPGVAVQVAVLPDDSEAWVTMYDTRQVARVDLATEALTILDLPADSAGPVQIYPSADGRSLWVADQGALDGDPVGHRLLRMSAETGAVELVAEVGQGPHGVVADEDGERVWATMLVDGTVQAIDAHDGRVLTTTFVGEAPNGISCVHGDASMP